MQKALVPRKGQEDDAADDLETGYDVVDLRSMGKTQRRLVVDRAMATSDQDNERFLQKYADRLERWVWPILNQGMHMCVHEWPTMRTVCTWLPCLSS